MAGPTAEFQTPLDIGNRAAQLIGAPRFNTFLDDTKAASEIAFVYDKVRRAELQRNNWRFSIRTCALRAIDTTSLEYIPATWNASDTYLVGSIVSYNNQIWQATNNVPVSQQPDISPTYWDVYFGPMTVTPWSATVGNTTGPSLWSSVVTYLSGQQVQAGDGFIYTSLVSNNLNNNPTTDNGVHWLKGSPAATEGGYFAGELVYVQSGNTLTPYVSLSNGNADNPATIQVWNASTPYKKNDTVVQSSTTYQSLIDLNLANTPPSAQWETIPAGEPQTMAGSNWLQLDGTLASIRLVYPIGSGPRSQSTTLNVYQLPNGYLKMAPQDPKSGNASYLGSPANLQITDWRFQGNYLLTRQTNVLVFRFAADVTNVATMTSMFCEGLACRVAAAVCEAVTQSTAKLGMLGQEYKSFMGEARLSNAIELSSDEPPLDDWISCRL